MTADNENPAPAARDAAASERDDQAGPDGQEETHAVQHGDSGGPGGVTNIVRGHVGSVVQLGHVYGDINL
ncbi:MAG: hypothetical protein FWE35_00950 [Streptosporangiales bacterium]|nr:hypothetical protein [Streptosporangiales bacterium]